MIRTGLGLGLAAVALAAMPGVASAGTKHSVARQWNEEMLNAIRNDYARPTVHARNLYHVSAAMYDAWAAYGTSDQVLHQEKLTASNVAAARNEAISYAAYRILHARFAKSPGADETMPALDALMESLGYDPDSTSTVGDTPAALGNRVAVSVLFHGLNDGANEQGGYANLFYEPINPPLLPDFPGNPDIVDANRWQPLALEWFEDQSGNVIIGGYPDALGPEWGIVTPFSLQPEEASVYHRDGFDYWVYHDPGPPPYLGTETEDYYKWGNEMVSVWSSHLDPADGVMIDISPASIGNSPLPEAHEWAEYYDFYEGGDWGTGYDLNPVTGQPYEEQLVPRADYGRVLAEFWADGPDSETPPGHWFTLLNYVNDHPMFEKRFGGEGDILDDLEWDVKSYVLMGGMMHDVAVSAWGIKGWYDYIRPISAIRHMCALGQSSDPDGPSFNEQGIGLHDGLIEVVTAESTAPGQRHEHLVGFEGRIAVKAWKGPDFIDDPDTDVAGVDWILADYWWPYQRPSFVTPPFPGYVSGHSTFSRGASELMTLLTGSEYWPGGMSAFVASMNEFLVFEEGPSTDVILQWATYQDASDQTSLSRIWGGIHPGADDIPGRQIGQVIGPEAYHHGVKFFNGQVSCPADQNGDRMIDVQDLVAIILDWGPCENCPTDTNDDGAVDVQDLINTITAWGQCD
ncbi:MAG: DUF6851 domain-containing protein [Planctomycetota bacterium]